MIRDPLILVECDVCGETYEYSMTRTGRGWDDRGMEKRLEEEGWTVEQEGLRTVCPECVQEEAEEAEEVEREEEAEKDYYLDIDIEGLEGLGEADWDEQEGDEVEYD